MITGRNKSDVHQNLFQKLGWILLFVYMLLPFGKSITEILHQISHVTVMISDQNYHSHHNGDSQNTLVEHSHHHHPHSASDSGANGDHVHQLLNSINDFFNLAPDSNNTEYVVQKIVDKHVKTDQPLFRSPCYAYTKTSFLWALEREREKHTYTNINPPDLYS